jgi:hypothetical protein
MRTPIFPPIFDTLAGTIRAEFLSPSVHCLLNAFRPSARHSSITDSKRIPLGITKKFAFATQAARLLTLLTPGQGTGRNLLMMADMAVSDLIEGRSIVII